MLMIRRPHHQPSKASRIAMELLSPLRITGGILFVGITVFYGLLIPYATRTMKIKRERRQADTPRTASNEDTPPATSIGPSHDDIKKAMLQRLHSPSNHSTRTTRTLSTLLLSHHNTEDEQRPPSDEEIGVFSRPIQLDDINERCSSSCPSDERKQSPIPWCAMIDWDGIMSTATGAP